MEIYVNLSQGSPGLKMIKKILFREKKFDNNFKPQ